jgi:hypothetical protein
VLVAAVVVDMAGQMLVKVEVVAAVVEVGQKLADGLTPEQQGPLIPEAVAGVVVTQTLLMVYSLVAVVAQGLLLFRYPQETIPVHLRDRQSSQLLEQT